MHIYHIVIWRTNLIIYIWQICVWFTKTVHYLAVSYRSLFCAVANGTDIHTTPLRHWIISLHVETQTIYLKCCTISILKHRNEGKINHLSKLHCRLVFLPWPSDVVGLKYRNTEDHTESANHKWLLMCQSCSEMNHRTTAGTRN